MIKKENRILKGIFLIVAAIVGMGFTVSYSNLSFLWFPSIITIYYGIYKINIWAPPVMILATIIYQIASYYSGKPGALTSLVYFSLMFAIFLAYAILSHKKIIKF